MLRFLFVGRNGAQSGTNGFRRYAWLVVGYNILVILWGTVVRATGSGAGCGDHWPLCGGQVIPHAAAISTAIEFAHRLTSAVAVLLVVGLVYLAFSRFSKRHPARRYAAAALVFTFTEGLIGAALVLTGDVGNNASASRVFILSLHLVNTFLLLASLALTADSAQVAFAPKPDRDSEGRAGPQAVRPRGLVIAYASGLLGALGLAVTGTIAALADTLFHATSISQGFQWDFSGASSPLIHLRILHPVIAVFVGTYLIVLAVHTLLHPAPPRARRAAACLGCLVLAQFCLGMLNVLLLTPLWTQLLHLLTADLIWIALVLLAHVALERPFAVAAECPAAVPMAAGSARM